MNLIFRLIWMWITATFGSPRDIMGESTLRFRCLPTDLDVNMHMTNSRYHSFMDLNRIDFMIRNGGWKKLRAAGYNPVVGSSSIRFRRPIAPLKKFDVTCRILSWNERWMFMEQKLVVAGDLAAYAVVKVAFIGKEGRVSMDKLMEISGYTGAKPDFIPLLQKKEELDGLLKS